MKKTICPAKRALCSAKRAKRALCSAKRSLYVDMRSFKKAACPAKRALYVDKAVYAHAKQFKEPCILSTEPYM